MNKTKRIFNIIGTISVALCFLLQLPDIELYKAFFYAVLIASFWSHMFPIKIIILAFLGLLLFKLIFILLPEENDVIAVLIVCILVIVIPVLTLIFGGINNENKK